MHGPGLQPLGRAALSPRPASQSGVVRWLRPLLRFFHVESASGLVLLACTFIALALANSAWAADFFHFWHTPVGFSFGAFSVSEPLHWWINDGLMTIFFFLVGLEIKREIISGELQNLRKAALPVLAAFGGMVAPATIYLLLQRGQPGQEGWGIPMATDIAFVVGFLALLGPRVPFGLKIALLTLAIADDIGAVLVIAVFYSTNISAAALGLAALGIGLILVLKRLGVRSLAIYLLVGAAIWLAFLKSGVHPTLAGVLLGLLTPASVRKGEGAFNITLEGLLRRLREGADSRKKPGRIPLLRELQATARDAVAPLEHLERGLHPWVAFGIMPLFALANAGVPLELAAIKDPISMAVAAGLFIGKPLGIVSMSWLAVRLGLAQLPDGVNWKIMFAAGCLAGIGFTMSLFIAGLALDGGHLEAGKVGTLTGSTLSAIFGFVFLLAFLPKDAATAALSEEKAKVTHLD